MKILVMNGSPRKVARTRSLANYAVDSLKKHDVEVTYFDARDNQLPLYNGDEDQGNHEEVQNLTKMAAEADGFVLCSPEYHNGMSGALKNALDFLSFEQFGGKPVALAATAGGGKGGINGLNNMRIVARGVGAQVLGPQFVCDPDMLNDKLELSNDAAKERMDGMLAQLVQLAKALNA